MLFVSMILTFMAQFEFCICIQNHDRAWVNMSERSLIQVQVPLVYMGANSSRCSAFVWNRCLAVFCLFVFLNIHWTMTCTVCVEFSESCDHCFNSRPPEIPSNVSLMSEGAILTSGSNCRKPLSHMLWNSPLCMFMPTDLINWTKAGEPPELCAGERVGVWIKNTKTQKVVEGKLHLRSSKRTRSDVLQPYCTSCVSMSDNTATLQCVDGS